MRPWIHLIPTLTLALAVGCSGADDDGDSPSPSVTPTAEVSPSATPSGASPTVRPETPAPVTATPEPETETPEQETDEPATETPELTQPIETDTPGTETPATPTSPDVTEIHGTELPPTPDQSTPTPETPTPETPTPETPTPDHVTPTPGEATVTEEPTAAAATLYERLGETAGITTVVNDFVGRVVGDPKINSYFLNSSVDATRLSGCLVVYFVDLSGGPDDYDTSGCKSMKEVHAGMGISSNDYNDLAGHLVNALSAAKVSTADINTIVAALTDPGVTGDIIEDADNDLTIYQRVGRRPAIETVVEDFVGRVVADPKINGYFLNKSVNAERLTFCLVRQVCSLDGPCNYGEEVEDPIYIDGKPVACLDMATVHDGLRISANDFNDLVGHLASALEDGGVAADDIQTIAFSLTSPLMKQDIIEDNNSDGNFYQQMGRKPTFDAIIEDFIPLVVADTTLVGFFGNTNVPRLDTCLVRQLCQAAGGPCIYGEEVEPEVGSNPCKAMDPAHNNLTNSQGEVITVDDFNALTAHLLDAAELNGFNDDQQMFLANVLNPLCPDIVANPTGCPGGGPGGGDPPPPPDGTPPPPPLGN